MSKRLDIFLKPSEHTIGWRGPKGYRSKALPADLRAFAQALSQQRKGYELAGTDVDVYLDDDLLFFTKISLPLQTPDIKKAIALQLDMLSPFGDDSLSAFAASRGKEGYTVTLYLCRRSQVTPFLDILFKAGAHLTGLYPESQRYLTRANQKLSWSLWSPGRFGKITHFNQGKVVSRDFCANQVSEEQIKERTGSATLFQIGSLAAGTNPALSLLAHPASVRAYNMLPSSFQRPDYMKKAMVALAALNLLLLVILAGGKAFTLYHQADVVDQQIEATRLNAEEAAQTKARINKLAKKLDAYRTMGPNTDLIAFMATLSKELPNTAYLDQFRLDQANRTITLQGYTDDLPGLTAKIPDLGTATLKSTMKRRNQTYFHLEVSLP